MDTHIFKVLSQSEAQTITRLDGSQTQKSAVVLQELGNQYADSYVASLVGNQIRFSVGELVVAVLRFTTHEYAGNTYQDINIQEIYKLCN